MVEDFLDDRLLGDKGEELHLGSALGARQWEYLSRLKDVGTAYRDIMGKNYPAMAVVVVKGLIEDGAKLEIETTAVV